MHTNKAKLVGMTCKLILCIAPVPIAESYQD